ncbi:protein ripply2 [Indicator indicator]|uniref:protein ripply2 n=1 Tax=Indicator indicator TaxID=1002788 RepID=UPI0023DF62A1|nr:protein ripply2 [Indicator indicator]
MSRGRWAPRRAPAAIKPSGSAAGRVRRAAVDRQRMEGRAMGCSCPRPPSAALPPPGYLPFSSRCGARSGPALTVLPLPRRSVPFWRPWVPTPAEEGRQSVTSIGPAAPHSPCGLAEASRKLAQYTHPVRLFWPKSRCYDYLYQEAEALLKNFPVQATISFYEDSESEDDDDNELEQDSRTESDC